MNRFKSGYIAIVGRPNVGKSTLLNALIGEKLAAVTDKPQTTRHRILGIKTTSAGQLLFLDMPGIHRPHKTLNEYMVAVARTALEEADLFLFVVEPQSHLLADDRAVFALIRKQGKPVILAINKSDKAGHDALLPVMAMYQQEFLPAAIVPTVATRGTGIPELEQEILARLSEGPAYFPEDQISDVSERFLAAETIREKAMAALREEIPYSLAVEIEKYEEPKEGDRKPVIRIRASIIVEKDSQKGIVIGKGGGMLKRIGTLAREEMESRLGQKVFLELFVRVEPDWTKDPNKVKEFAYS